MSFPEDETLRAKSAGERVALENIALIGGSTTLDRSRPKIHGSQAEA